eukprot:g33028.t1
MSETDVSNDTGQPEEDNAHADIGLVCALAREVGPFLDKCLKPRKYTGGNFTFRGARYEGIRIAAVESGMGFVRARKATQALIDAHSPPWVISIGYSGALQPGMKVGDIVLANSIVDTHGNELAVDLNMPEQKGLHVGRFVTSDEMVRLVKEKQALGEKYDAIAVDMESLAVAQICRETKTRFMAVRVLSDDMSFDLPPEVLTVVGESGSLRLGATIGSIWRRPGSVKDMWRLREAAIIAGTNLATFLEALSTQGTIMLDRANAFKHEIVRTRRDLHAHPELGFEEIRTSGIVAETLTQLGYQNVQRQVGRTGVVAELGSADGPVIGVRADMDALPIQEETPHPFKSENPGVMHACGHDCHTSILLGAAKLLKDEYDQNGADWRGRVRLLFQPCEEKFDENGISGATAMIDDGALEGVDEVIALHIISSLDAGVLQFCDGLAMAAVDSFEVVIHGDGGHGAYPHQGSDPLFMLSTVLPNLFGIPSRRIAPLKPCVVSLGEIRGGAAPNVIPSEVYLQGTIRSLDDTVRESLWEEVENCFRLVEGLGGRYDFTLHKGYPSLNNNETTNTKLRAVAADLIDEDRIAIEQFGMGGRVERKPPVRCFCWGVK